MAIVLTKQKSLYISAGKYILAGFLSIIISRLLLDVNAFASLFALVAFPFIAWQGTSFILGAQGEARVTREIKKLNDNYHLFNDIKIPGNQIDHILVCPKGIFTLETKNYLRDVYGYGTGEDIRFAQFVNRKRYWIKSPISQARRHTIALANLLKQNEIEIPFIKTLVLFAGRAAIKMPNNNIPIVYRKELINYLLRQRDEMNEQQIQYYTNKIVDSLKIKTNIIKQSTDNGNSKSSSNLVIKIDNIVGQNEMTRKCPYCAEIIKAEAIYCRFCNHNIKSEKDIENENQFREKLIQERRKVGKSMLKQAIIGLVFMLIGFILLSSSCSKLGNDKADSGAIQFSLGFFSLIIGLLFVLVARIRLWWNGGRM